MQRAVPDVNLGQHISGISGFPLSGSSKLSLQEIRPLNSLAVPLGALQPEQLAQLAASLLEQQRQSGSSLSATALDDPRQTNRINGSDNSSIPSPKYAVENNLVNFEPSTSQFGQVLQLQKQQQMSNVPQLSRMVKSDPQRGFSGNQQLLDSGLQEDAEADPQKRLQARLQLAAVLLQQIQRRKGS